MILTTMDRDKMICELHDQGNSRRDIERLVGVSDQVVRRVLYHSQRTETTPPIAARRRAVDKLTREGLNVELVAAALCVGVDKVEHDLHNLAEFRKWRRRHTWDRHAASAAH